MSELVPRERMNPRNFLSSADAEIDHSRLNTFIRDKSVEAEKVSDNEALYRYELFKDSKVYHVRNVDKLYSIIWFFKANFALELECLIFEGLKSTFYIFRSLIKKIQDNTIPFALVLVYDYNR